MAEKIYMASTDTERTVTFDLYLDGEAQDMGSATIECHMTNIRTNTVTTITDIVADADQVANTGRVVTEFTAAQLVAGTYTLEWEATIGTSIVTYPGNGDERPVLVVRPAAA